MQNLNIFISGLRPLDSTVHKPIIIIQFDSTNLATPASRKCADSNAGVSGSVRREEIYW